MRFLTILCILCHLAGAGGALGGTHGETPDQNPIPSAPKEQVMTIRGTFEVRMIPQPADHESANPIGRLLLEKTYHGDLEATSHGQMLAFRATVDGSAGYVAMEQVTGTLGGRHGSFVLQHGAVMDRGEAPALTAVVVPDSGTEELTGLTGELDLIVEDGKHTYAFRYSLGEE